MRLSPVAGVALAWLLTTAADEAAKPMQPPMNDFGFAFYNCADGGAFQIIYDSPDAPSRATMITNDNNRKYELARTPDATGAAFAKGATKFWTNGKSVLVEGTSQPLKSCKLKAG